MNTLSFLCIFTLIPIALLTNPEDFNPLLTQADISQVDFVPINTHVHRPRPKGFVHTLHHYFRVAKNRFNCFFWGTNCSKPSMHQEDSQRNAGEFEDHMVDVDWFNKNIYKENEIEAKDQISQNPLPKMAK